MRRLVVALFAGSLGTWGLAGALGGCGEEAGAINGSEAGAGSSSGGSSSGGGSSGTPAAEAGGGDGGGIPVTDGGTDGASSSSGSAAPNPGKISCGASECDGGGFSPDAPNRCCIRDGGAGPVAACSTANACGDDDLELRCDEPSDCPEIGGFQQRCCLRADGAGFGGKRSECSFGCGSIGNPGGGVQMCKTNADCGDGGANQPSCNQKTCGGFSVRVCGSPTGCL